MGIHYIIINHCFIHNAISLSQCRRLPYAFCTRPPSLYGILAQSLTGSFTTTFFMLLWLVPCKLVDSQISELKAGNQTNKEKKKWRWKKKEYIPCLFPLARETISANHKDRLLTNDKPFVDSTHLESTSWHQSHWSSSFKGSTSKTVLIVPYASTYCIYGISYDYAFGTLPE